MWQSSFILYAMAFPITWCCYPSIASWKESSIPTACRSWRTGKTSTNIPDAFVCTINGLMGDGIVCTTIPSVPWLQYTLTVLLGKAIIQFKYIFCIYYYKSFPKHVFRFILWFLQYQVMGMQNNFCVAVLPSIKNVHLIFVKKYGTKYIFFPIPPINILLYVILHNTLLLAMKMKLHDFIYLL